MIIVELWRLIVVVMIILLIGIVIGAYAQMHIIEGFCNQYELSITWARSSAER